MSSPAVEAARVEPAELSIIIVTKNAVQGCRMTLESIREQTRSAEVIVIDGASTDGTMTAVGAFDGTVSRVVSEPDRGIYHAMNKGIALATGEYVMFLNAGDSFAGVRVLDDVAAELRRHGRPDLLFGNVIYVYPDRLRRRRFSHINRITLPHYDLCHQAVFSRRDLFDRYGRFDLRLRFAADYDWLLRIFQSEIRACYVDLDVAFYDSGGATAVHSAIVEEERRKILRRYYSHWRLAASRLAIRPWKRVVHGRDSVVSRPEGLWTTEQGLACARAVPQQTTGEVRFRRAPR